MEIENRSWLITGGCGFLGTSLIARLKKLNPDIGIRVLDNLSVGTREDLSGVSSFAEKKGVEISGSPNGVELVIGDIRDYEICMAACNGIDVVAHFAANTGVAPSVENPRLDLESNVLGTFNLLESSRHSGVGNFVFASSGAPVGETEPPIHEEKAPRPVSPYGASKLAGEGYCSAYYRTFGLKTVALRFGNVYGPLSKHKNSVIAKFFRLALAGEPLEIYGDGGQTRDFLYIDDLVSAVVAASRFKAGGEVFQIATRRETTVSEIASAIKSLVEEKTGKKVGIIHGEDRLGDVRRNFSDITKARKLLGWGPEYDLVRGLRETMRYFLKAPA